MPPAPRETRTYIGIDPGQSGGLVAITELSVPNHPGAWEYLVGSISPMPSTERDIWDWFEPYPPATSIALIEKVHAFPGQGVSSTFKFGQNYGFLRGCLTATSIAFEEITPRSWQKGLGITAKKGTESNSQWKNRLKQKAQQLFPEVKVTLKTADALLIAEFCRRTKR